MLRDTCICIHCTKNINLVSIETNKSTKSYQLSEYIDLNNVMY